MSFLPKLSEKVKKIQKPSLIIYPVVIMVAIPLLLVASTVWNLNSFNRDVNFLIRHQAVSLSDTLRPIFANAISQQEDTTQILKSLTENEDLISASILEKDGNKFRIHSSSEDDATPESVSQDALNRFADSLNQAFAGLTYDSKLQQNVWVVTIPLRLDSEKPLILALKLSTKTVDEILTRTSRDSLVVLVVLVVATLVLLANHFFFYKKSLRAQQLEEIDRLKDEFISVASHELKAPITAIIGYLEMLKEDLPPEVLPKLANSFKILEGLTNDLTKLVEDLLEVSRIEQGRIKIVTEKVNVNQLITTTISELDPLAKQKGLAMAFTPTPIPATLSDSHRISQILTNLVSNAIKYSLKGNITISAIVKRNQIEIKVKDTGVGIPPEAMSKLFAKFYRIQDEKTQDVRGTGLGLWITKQLVETLGGKIYVESIYGSGSSFTFTLPVRS